MPNDNTTKLECSTLGISIEMSRSKTHNVATQLSGGGKLNRTDITLPLCCDSRGTDCPYWLKISANTDHINFEQNFCGYAFRNK